MKEPAVRAMCKVREFARSATLISDVSESKLPWFSMSREKKRPKFESQIGKSRVFWSLSLALHPPTKRPFWRHYIGYPISGRAWKSMEGIVGFRWSHWSPPSPKNSHYSWRSTAMAIPLSSARDYLRTELLSSFLTPCSLLLVLSALVSLPIANLLRKSTSLPTYRVFTVTLGIGKRISYVAADEHRRRCRLPRTAIWRT